VNYTLVGVFVLVLTSLLIAGVLWIASGGTLQKKYDTYLAIEGESVAGLNINAPVKYNGVELGKVSKIQLDPANPERVQLTFAIERGTPIKADTVAVLKTQGLTGIAYVELGGGSGDAPLLQPRAEPPYPVIRTKPSLSARLENVLTTVLAKLDHTSSNIDALLSPENLAALTSTLTNLAIVTHTLAARKDVIDAGIVSAGKAASNTAALTEQLKPITARIGRAADAIEKMGHEVSGAGIATAKTAEAIGAEARRFDANTLPEIRRLLTELSSLTNSLRRLSEQTASDPAGLIRGRSPVPDGPGEAAAGQEHQ